MEPVGTVTFLFTDIEGSTRLVAQLRAAYADVLEQHRTILREAAGRYDGEEVDTQGDAFFFSFHRAQDAVLAAAEAQRALTAHAWPDGAQVRVRMGIHTGEPGRSVTGYHGLGVVRAARISAAGHGGQVLISQVTRSLVEDEELPGIGFQDLGEHGLKDLERPERLFQLVLDGLPSEFPPPRGVESQTVKEEFVARRRRIRVRLLVPIGVLAVAVAAVVAYVMTRGAAAPITVAPSSLAAIDPRTNRVVADIKVGQTPIRVAVGAGSVWTLNADEQTISEIDPSRRALARTFGASGSTDDLAIAEDGSVWVARAPRTVVEIDSSTGAVERRVHVDLPVADPADVPGLALAAGDGRVWAVGPSMAYAAVDVRSGLVVARGSGLPHLRVGGTPNGPAAAVGPTGVWATSGLNTLGRITPAPADSVDLGDHEQKVSRVAVGADAIWVAATGANAVWRVQPQTVTVQGTVGVGAAPLGVALGAGSVWTANTGGGTVSRIDPATGKVTTIHVGGSPSDIAYAGGLVWVAVL